MVFRDAPELCDYYHRLIDTVGDFRYIFPRRATFTAYCLCC